MSFPGRRNQAWQFHHAVSAADTAGGSGLDETRLTKQRWAEGGGMKPSKRSYCLARTGRGNPAILA